MSSFVIVQVLVSPIAIDAGTVGRMLSARSRPGRISVDAVAAGVEGHLGAGALGAGEADRADGFVPVDCRA